MFANCTFCQGPLFKDAAFLFAIAALIWAWNHILED